MQSSEYIPALMKLQGVAQEKIWGGQLLSQLHPRLSQTDGSSPLQTLAPIGEIWEVSNLKGGESFYGGQKLNQITQTMAHAFWGKADLPYLIKFIDTSQELSIQVHPDDAYALRHENSSGKAECWIILQAGPGAGVYLGLKEGIDKKNFAQLLATQGPVEQALNFYPIQRGDFFFVPPGGLHAIGKNTLLLEVQQSSGVTYRAWDWNRTDSQGRPRDLHIKQALEVTNFLPEHNLPANFQIKHNVLSREEWNIFSSTQFQVTTMHLSRKKSKKIFLHERMGASALVNLQGQVRLCRGREEILLNPFESCLCPFQGEDHLILTVESEAGAEVVVVS